MLGTTSQQNAYRLPPACVVNGCSSLRQNSSRQWSPGKAHCDRRCVRERGAEFVPLSMKYRPVEHHRIHCTGKSEEATKTANKTVDEKMAVDENGATMPLPVGDMKLEEFGIWQSASMRLKLFLALPWQRCKGNSVLSFNVSGTIQDQLPASFSKALSLPVICEALIKAAYDPRIKGLYMSIEALDCGWAKLTEIRRHIEFFRQSGKFTIAYLDRGSEKEYFLASACEELFVPPSGNVFLRGLTVGGTFLRGGFGKAGIEPQVRRIGKYKSAGDQFMREDMSEPQREQLTALLEDLFDGFTSHVATARSKTPVAIADFLDAPYVNMDSLKEEGLVTDLKYKDEILDMLKERLGVDKKKKVSYTTLSRYRRVPIGTFGLKGRARIAVIRASGAIINSASGPAGGQDVISASTIIRQIREAGENEKIKAIVLRIDSPGGDALASDLMWREIRKVAKDKPIIASMGDVAASGGYYMAMGADKIVAEALTITGSIGVVLAKFNLGELYDKVGIGKQLVSRGKYAELFADNRSFNEDEDELFTSLAENAYADFRGKAANSRNLTVDEMENIAQGRVWSGKQGLSIGLVDALGGISRALAIAKQAAGINPEDKVTLVELSKKQGSPLELLQASGTLTNVVSSIFFVIYGLASSGWGYFVNEGQVLDGVGWLLLGAMGLKDFLAPKQDEKWEYTMEEVDMTGSSSVIPQAILDSSFLSSTPFGHGLGTLVKKL